MGAQEEGSAFDRSVNNSWPPITGGRQGGWAQMHTVGPCGRVSSWSVFPFINILSEVSYARRQVQKCRSVAQFLGSEHTCVAGTQAKNRDVISNPSAPASLSRHYPCCCRGKYGPDATDEPACLRTSRKYYVLSCSF